MAKKANKVIKRRSVWQEATERLFRNRLAMLGLAILLIVIILCSLAGVICPDGQNAQNPSNALIAPCKEFIFGTDQLGRSMLSRVLYGGRVSILIAFVSTAISAALGTILGTVAAYYGGTVDDIIMRVLDVFSAIPNLLLAIALAAILGSGVFNCMLAVGVAAVPGFARVVRAPILAVMNNEYIEAARSIDATDRRIMFVHVLPNVLSPIIVQATTNLAQAILMAASLSFLGLGVQAPNAEWGALLSTGREFIKKQPYLTMVPGMAIASVVFSMNLFGDGVRDALDPKLKY